MSTPSTAGDSRISDLDLVTSVLPGDLVPLARGLETLAIELRTLIALAKGAPGAPGRDWRPDGFGPLTDSFVQATELAGELFVYVVDPGGDQRADLNVPAALAGDQAGCAVSWNPSSGWVSYGPIAALPGPTGPGVPAGGTAGQILEKLDGDDYNARWVSKSSPTWGGLIGKITDQLDLVQALSARASLTNNNTFSGMQSFGAAITENVVQVTGAEIDLSAGNYFVLTLTGNVALSVSNVPSDGVVAFILDVKSMGVFNVTFWNGITWPGGIQPIFTANGRDTVGFLMRADGSCDGIPLGANLL